MNFLDLATSEVFFIVVLVLLLKQSIFCTHGLNRLPPTRRCSSLHTDFVSQAQSGCLFLICVRLCVSSFFCEDAYSARPLFLRHNALRGLTGLLEEAVWITPPPPPCEMRGLLIPRLWVTELCCRGPPVYALWVWSRFVLIIRCVRFYKDGILTIQIAVFNDPQTLSGS